MIKKIGKIRLLRLIAMLMSIFALFANGCSSIMRENRGVVGVVKLSDNPPSGHGGVVVSNGYLTTMSDYDGRYTLEGSIYGKRSFTVTFSMPGYDAPSYEVTLEYSSDDENAPELFDLGTMVLNKLTE